MPTNVIVCYKAESFGAGQPPVPDAHIHIERSLPAADLQLPSLESWRNLHRAEAAHLADALMASLPQGTMHELLVVLLQRYASVYQGPTTDAGPITQTSKDGVLR